MKPQGAGQSNNGKPSSGPGMQAANEKTAPSIKRGTKDNSDSRPVARKSAWRPDGWYNENPRDAPYSPEKPKEPIHKKTKKKTSLGKKKKF